jgi:hypothetical protein
MAVLITADYAWQDKRNQRNQRTRRLTAKSNKSKKFYPYISVTYLLSYLLLYYLLSSTLSLIFHLSLSNFSLIHPSSIRHRSRQAEYRHAAALRTRRGSTAAA